MRVLHIGLGAMQGGMESFLANLIKKQKEDGIDPELIFATDLGAGKDFEKLCRVYYSDSIQLEEILLKNRYDLLHIGNSSSHWAAVRIKRSCYDGPIILTSHHLGACENIFRSDCVVAVSEAVVESIKYCYGDKIRVIYNGIDTSLFYPSSQGYIPGSKPIIAWVGRINDNIKNAGLLMDFIKSDKAAEFQIIIADASPSDSEINILPENVEIATRIRYEDMPDFYRKIARSRGVLLSTSKMEACPMNMLEAQACGCPVIAPKVGGIPEIVKDKATGCLYELSDEVNGIIESLNWLYNGSDYTIISSNAVNHIMQSHRVEDMARNYKKLYEYVIKNHKKSLSRTVAFNFISLGWPLIKKFSHNEVYRVG